MAVFKLVFHFKGKPSQSAPYQGTLAKAKTHADNQRRIHNADEVELFDDSGKLILSKSRPPKKS